MQAENTHNADTPRAILDARVMIISDRGVRSREEFIAGVIKGPIDPTQPLTYRKIVIDGDTAVVTVIDTLRGNSRRPTGGVRLPLHHDLPPARGQWRALVEVFTPPPPTP